MYKIYLHVLCKILLISEQIETWLRCESFSLYPVGLRIFVVISLLEISLKRELIETMPN
jgi:hypothetical protein